mmetsp:Transcript_1005/g.2797  ORF Transcript_1005/g.2797 Transcript_1005/m.2797 type:complete len:219 (-) Transcript_1005:2340-2996(-)
MMASQHRSSMISRRRHSSSWMTWLDGTGSTRKWSSARIVNIQTQPCLSTRKNLAPSLCTSAFVQSRNLRSSQTKMVRYQNLQKMLRERQSTRSGFLRMERRWEVASWSNRPCRSSVARSSAWKSYKRSHLKQSLSKCLRKRNLRQTCLPKGSVHPGRKTRMLSRPIRRTAKVNSRRQPKTRNGQANRRRGCQKKPRQLSHQQMRRQKASCKSCPRRSS